MIAPPEVTEADVGRVKVMLPEQPEKAAPETIAPDKPGLREQLTRLGAYGWIVWFLENDDGTRLWWVTDLEGKTILQEGRTNPGDDWQDAVLDAVSNLYPPSPEGRAG